MSVLQLSDNELLDLYLKGDQSAMSNLIERHTPRVRSYVRMLVKDSDTADDIFQETFIKAVKMIDAGRYADSGRFLSWVLRIAHNLSIDHFRARRSSREVAESEIGYDIMGSAHLTEDSVEDRIVREQIDKDLRRLITLLPQEQREVVEQRYFSQMSFKEIAEHSNVSINTALGRMRYALINLRKMIKENNLILS